MTIRATRKSRNLDSMTIEENLTQDRGLSREVIRTLMTPGTGGICGLGPDVLSAYCPYGFAELHTLDDSPDTGWQAFPDGNAGIARHLVKTLIPNSIPGPKTLEAISRGNLDFSTLDRQGQPGAFACVRLSSAWSTSIPVSPKNRTSFGSPTRAITKLID